MIVPASRAHVRRIANRMREDDRIECEAFGHSPVEALRLGLLGSNWALTGMQDGPQAMMGVAPVNALEGIGRPWMLGTDAIYGCARSLLSDGPAVIALMHRRYRRLENVVSERNERAIRMLKRWGFEIGGKLEVGGVMFRHFWRESDV